LRLSDDAGETWSDWDSDRLGVEGEYRCVPEWRALGMFDFPGVVGEVRVTDPVPFRLSAIKINDPKGGRDGQYRNDRRDYRQQMHGQGPMMTAGAVVPDLFRECPTRSSRSIRDRCNNPGAVGSQLGVIGANSRRLTVRPAHLLMVARRFSRLAVQDAARDAAEIHDRQADDRSRNGVYGSSIAPSPPWRQQPYRGTDYSEHRSH
jgi:hypothetical protein